MATKAIGMAATNKMVQQKIGIANEIS